MEGAAWLTLERGPHPLKRRIKWISSKKELYHLGKSSEDTIISLPLGISKAKDHISAPFPLMAQLNSKAKEGQDTPAELFIARGAAGNTDQLVRLEQPMLSLTPPKTNVFPSCTSTEACELHSMLYDDLPASDVSYDIIWPLGINHTKPICAPHGGHHVTPILHTHSLTHSHSWIWSDSGLGLPHQPPGPAQMGIIQGRIQGSTTVVRSNWLESEGRRALRWGHSLHLLGGPTAIPAQIPYSPHIILPQQRSSGYPPPESPC